MFPQIALIFLAGVALILGINAAQTDPTTNCVQFGGTCDQHRRCCGENLKCDQSITFGIYECTEKAKLGDSCRLAFQCVDILHSVFTLGSACATDRDCKNIPNAICIDDKCVCKPETFALTPSVCTHLLNTNCLSSNDCGIDASHCFENKCQCKPDWAPLTDIMCVRRSGLYHCNDEIDCGVLWHSKCFQNKCVCNAKHIAVNALTCLPTLGGTCWKDDQCMTEKTHCVDFKCQCKPGFVSVAVNMCVANL
ncbi:hypothetical protein KQX54_001432 [Cotesia glomerata]|uniref:EGF-like domain-containing protein n=1 Tax=Cotesia glomerata TaxID=32391 RepID=A0AAV7IPG4_COTGL|nr:hypothetical protein KQX54_001432 [Cotesia glomerata]